MTSERATGPENPVIPGFHPDPSVCRVGSAYFLATSSFTYFPGVPIFRSTDLVSWTQIGNALDRRSQLDLSATRGWSSLGVYAPTLRHHAGRFWLITTTTSSSGKHSFFVTTEDPAGPWSEPVPVDIDDIDPDIAWDDAGNCWVTYAGIKQCRIDDTTGKILEGPHPTWSGTGLQFPEAPHLFRRGDQWYLLIAEGGTERGHSVSIARGPSPQGPWEGCPANPILSHRSTDRPVQNTGHADMVEAPDGSWWMVLLGVRPRGLTPGFHMLGRETFLTSVTWGDDGWPTVGPVELNPASTPAGTTTSTETAGGRSLRDDFDAAALHPSWITVRRPLDNELSLARRPGWLTLIGTSATMDDPEPVFVGRRQQHHRCRARSLIDADGCAEAGLSIRMDEYSHYEVAVQEDQILARARIGPLASVVAQAPKPDGPVILGIDTETESALGNPDEIVLGYEAAEGFVALATLDGRYLSTEVASGFTGRVIGMYAHEGTAAFDWFSYEGLT
ncbi:glycoside hydrolase family 43 protein [Actinomadura rudentiformis]|uniref:Glycoside hydrolase family 43 protein n=1 Tax=Actinomadura rudentiformis TaxID=359158 RepID=A0A6H9YQM3_9ACTN|nr:glycoside hydrolase family 43 protein [Actinomadura rudentiformis]KAB2341576.1 glycoside hydrolase family 43 protein [Actinomadura rudentiformis]